MKSVTSIRGQPFHLSGQQKDHNVAENLRNEGKLMFNTGKLFEALEFYNKSLSAAQLDSPDIPLAYVERSAVYFEAKQYQLCLDNIQLAYDHGKLPEEKIEKLRVLEEDCREMMTTHVTDPDDEPWNFFKLSYAPHDKVPFIVNCLELQQSDNFGRFVITTQGQTDYVLDTSLEIQTFLPNRSAARRCYRHRGAVLQDRPLRVCTHPLRTVREK